MFTQICTNGFVFWGKQKEDREGELHFTEHCKQQRSVLRDEWKIKTVSRPQEVGKRCFRGVG